MIGLLIGLPDHAFGVAGQVFGGGGYSLVRELRHPVGGRAAHSLHTANSFPLGSVK